MKNVTEFLSSLKADLLDRRLLPLVGVAVVALVAAVAYAALAGGSSSPTVAATPPTAPSRLPGVAVTPSQPAPSNAVAETTNGSTLQRQGPSHNPFAPLPGAGVLNGVTSAAARTAASSTSSVSVATGKAGSGSTSTTTSSGSGSSGASTQESKPSTSSKPKAPSKPKTVYEVTVALGPIAAGSTEPSTELKALTPLSKPTPLPSRAQKLVEFMGVTVTAKGAVATFAVVGEVIIRGSGVCVPSSTLCKLVNLKEGTSEQLEYIQPSGQPAGLELRVDAITKQQASGTSFGVLLRAERAAASRSGDGSFLALAGLHYSPRIGVLAYSSRRHSR
jgi:hypothetical protein